MRYLVSIACIALLLVLGIMPLALSVPVEPTASSKTEDGKIHTVITLAKHPDLLPPPRTGFRGVYFNPLVKNIPLQDYPWPNFEAYTPEYRSQIKAILQELSIDANINLVDVFIAIPFTLSQPATGNRAGQPIREWGNLSYLDNAAQFVDDCHDAGIAVEFDLADNRWIPYTVDSANHIGKPGNLSYPVADDTPWDESATWYSEIINYIESRAKHPESIAMWGMMGNSTLGTAEPCLWLLESNPAILTNTEQFVKRVWPFFRSAGKRPKAAPYAFPIVSKDPYWMAKSPEQRLSGFTNLKKWLVDDLALPPDYWPMTTYPYCDPAPDGVSYLKIIVEILGKENASRILSTDLKGPGHEKEIEDSILSTNKHTGPEILEWHINKCTEYGFAGWWIYNYQDRTASGQQMGLREVDGHCKTDLVNLIKKQANRK